MQKCPHSRRGLRARLIPSGNRDEEKDGEDRLEDQARAEVNGSRERSGRAVYEVAGQSGRYLKGEVTVSDMGIHGNRTPDDLVFPRLQLGGIRKLK